MWISYVFPFLAQQFVSLLKDALGSPPSGQALAAKERLHLQVEGRYVSVLRGKAGALYLGPEGYGGPHDIYIYTRYIHIYTIYIYYILYVYIYIIYFIYIIYI
jgi:hypothetical protein